MNSEQFKTLFGDPLLQALIYLDVTYAVIVAVILIATYVHTVTITKKAMWKGHNPDAVKIVYKVVLFVAADKLFTNVISGRVSISLLVIALAGILVAASPIFYTPILLALVVLGSTIAKFYAGKYLVEFQTKYNQINCVCAKCESLYCTCHLVPDSVWNDIKPRPSHPSTHYCVGCITQMLEENGWSPHFMTKASEEGPK